jgi:hypothetical protein
MRIFFIFLITVIYATARYNLFKGVPWSDWPLYTMNKAFALSALTLLTISVMRQRSIPARTNASTLFMANFFATIHIVLSLMLLSPAYYEKLFLQGKFTATASLAMMLGALIAVAMAFGGKHQENQNPTPGIQILAILAFGAGMHAMLQGWAGWFTPLKWPGMMPPITLISFGLGLAALIGALFPKRMS